MGRYRSRQPRTAWRASSLGRAGSADLLIPPPEGSGQTFGREQRARRQDLDELIVDGPAELGEHVAALLRRHRERDALRSGAWIEIALVVGARLSFRLQHVSH